MNLYLIIQSDFNFELFAYIQSLKSLNATHSLRLHNIIVKVFGDLETCIYLAYTYMHCNNMLYVVICSSPLQIFTCIRMYNYTTILYTVYIPLV